MKAIRINLEKKERNIFENIFEMKVVNVVTVLKVDCDFMSDTRFVSLLDSYTKHFLSCYI